MEQDDWLGKMLGKPAYRIVGQGLELVTADLPQEKAFVEARVDVADSEALSHLQGLGFTVVDSNLTFERSAEDRWLGDVAGLSWPKVRFARAQDEQGVRALARGSFEYNRFRRDPLIPNEVANIIKDEWTANFFVGVRGDWMIVAEDETGIVGFMQLLSREAGVLTVDLIAVAAHRQRQGIARLMTGFSLNNCLDEPVRLRVGTQLSNRSSIQLYQAMGFTLADAVYILHLHKEAM